MEKFPTTNHRKLSKQYNEDYSAVMSSYENKREICDPSTCMNEFINSELEVEDIGDDNSGFLNEDSFDGDLEYPESSSESLSSCDSDRSVEEIDLCNKLKEWAIFFNVTKDALTALLKILHNVHSELPKCANTLLKNRLTTDVASKSQIVGEGRYVHFGLEKGLRKSIDVGIQKNNNYTGYIYQNLTASGNVLTLKIGIDGFSLFRSSNSCFWPILCVVNESIIRDPFPIGIYYGNNKPSNLKDFLKQFISEMRDLDANGVTHNNINYEVKLLCFVCDTPARSFLKCNKGHNGYFGCEFCIQRGVYVEGRMIFPELDSRNRLDSDFKERIDIDQHLCSISPLLEYVPFVTAFPPEYMHLVCLGIFRKLAFYYLRTTKNKRLACRIPPSRLIHFNEMIIICSKYLPFEFKRKLENEIEHWKATQFRTCFLFLGPFIFKNFLPDNYYRHFLLLNFSVYVLISDEFHIQFLEHARSCIKRFVHQMTELFGSASLIYNVHCLLHICDFVERFGQLDSFSAFPFENFLRHIRRKIHGNFKPLEQITNRILESSGHKSTTSRKDTSPKIGEQSPDNCFCLTDGTVLLVTKINGNTIVGLKLEFVEDLYDYPYASRLIGIGVYRCTNITISTDKSKFKKKAVAFKKENICGRDFYAIVPFPSMTLFQ